MLLDLGRALGLAHDVAGAIATFTEAAELARATGDAAALADAALGLPEVSEAEWLERVRGWCEEALRGLGEEDRPLKAKLLAQVAHSALFTADPRAIADASAAALAMAERLDDPPSLAIALRARQLARAAPTATPSGSCSAVACSRSASAPATRRTCCGAGCGASTRSCRPGACSTPRPSSRRVEPVVATLRRPLARLHLLRGRVALALGRGRFAEGRALNEETVALAERGGHLGASATARSLRLGIAARTGADPGDLEWIRTHPARMQPMAALSGPRWPCSSSRGGSGRRPGSGTRACPSRARRRSRRSWRWRWRACGRCCCPTSATPRPPRPCTGCSCPTPTCTSSGARARSPPAGRCGARSASPPTWRASRTWRCGTCARR